MRRRSESLRAVTMANHHSFDFNFTIRNRKRVEKYHELANFRFCFPFPQDNANKYCAVGVPERERRMRRWIAAVDCSLLPEQFLNCSGTKLDPNPSIFAVPQYLQRNLRKVDVRKQRKESQGNTTQTSKNKVFTTRKQTRRYTGTSG